MTVTTQADDITITDIQDAIGGSSSPPDNITITTQEDGIVITRAQEINVSIRD